MRNIRWALVGALAVAAMFVLAACGGAATPEVVTQVVTVEVPGQATAEPTAPPPDTIIICMGQEPDSLYNLTSTMAVTAQVVHAFGARGWYYDNAYFYGTEMLVNDEFPTLANGGATLDDGGTPSDPGDDVLTVTYKFKPDITWSDGVAFSVDDIIYTRDVILDPDSGATTRGILEQMVYEKIDDQTLKVTYPKGVKDPLYFLPPLSGPNAFSIPLPKHTLEGTAPADINTSDFARLPTPVLGPYEPKEWVAGDHITLEAVPNWWGGEIKTPKLIYRFITDSNQLLASVLSGDCDYATNDGMSFTQLPFIQQSASAGLLKYSAIPSTVWEHIDINTYPSEAGTEGNGMAFFADPRVRQALAFGTNRLQMTEEILFGEVTPLDSFLPSDHWAFNPELAGMYPYDPEKAKALLAEAGWEDTDGDGILEAKAEIKGEFSCGRGSWTIPAGTKFEVTMWVPGTPAMRGQLSTIFQSNMADIGIKVNLNTVASAGALFADGGPLYHRTAQLAEFAWVAGPDPSSLGLYSGINIYTWDSSKIDITNGPTGPFLTADQILKQKPDLLTGTNITEMMFKFGYAVDENADAAKLQFLKSDLPAGLTQFYPMQVPTVENDYTGQNNLGWCNEEATQALFDGDNVLDPTDRTPFFQLAQKLFMQDLPSLPLFQRVEIEAMVNSLCGPDKGPSNYASWNVEKWYFDSTGACGQ